MLVFLREKRYNRGEFAAAGPALRRAAGAPTGEAGRQGGRMGRLREAGKERNGDADFGG